MSIVLTGVTVLLALPDQQHNILICPVQQPGSALFSMSNFFPEGSCMRVEGGGGGNFPPGTVVERELDSTWYLARVTEVDELQGLYTIQYADDGNEESVIHHWELRRPANKGIFPSHIKKGGIPKPPVCLPIQELLLGDEARYIEKTPRIILHKAGMIQAEEVDSVAIINAPRLAVGVGLKGVRYLRKEEDRQLTTPRQQQQQQQQQQQE